MDFTDKKFWTGDLVPDSTLEEPIIDSVYLEVQKGIVTIV